MDALLKRARQQAVINSLDYKRLTKDMSAGEWEGFSYDVTVIDEINGIKVASLFDRSESFLDRAALQGALSVDDYGRLSPEDRLGVSVRGIKLDSDIQTVNVFDAVPITRAAFDSMIVAQKQDTVNKKIPIVDTMPEPDLTRKAIHTITARIAGQTKTAQE